ncbi:MAG TPA: NAD(P)-dependent oxidoreductase [Fimbriimonadaceae bacterium]|nr:NAD(P)-dependent oxidoreductase [Fimbriimonadaceae bacterium]
MGGLTRVRLGYTPPPEALTELRHALADLAVLGLEPDPEAEILVGGRFDDADLDGRSLRAVIVPWAGIPERLAEQLRVRPHVDLHNLHHNASTTAALAVGLLLSAARGIAEADRQMRQGVWRGRMTEDRGVLLSGKRATILGYGAIGHCVGEVLTALGMTVDGIRRSNRDRLDDALARSHVLVICAPLTPETRGLIDRQRIEMLQTPRLLVNVGRGAIVEERALYECLRDGTLFGAGVDVWYRYPQEGDEAPVWPSEYPIADLMNVTLSPHRAGDGEGIEGLRAQAVCSVLRDLCLGRPCRPVDLDRGY